MTNSGEDVGDNIAISLPPSLFNQDQVTDEDVGLAFTFYESANLFPLANGTRGGAVIGTSVLGALVAGKDVLNLDDPVQITLRLLNEVSIIQLAIDIVVSAAPSNCLEFHKPSMC